MIVATLLFAASAWAEPRLSVQARAVQRGEILLVVAEGVDPAGPPQGKFGTRDLNFFPTPSTGTWLALVGIDLDAPTGSVSLTAVLRDPQGRETRTGQPLQVLPGVFPVSTLTVDQKFVTPMKDDVERAERESERVHRLYARGDPKRLFDGRFEAPIPGAATAHFGERRVFNGQPRSPHSGMDLRAKAGTPVRAPAAGKVMLADPLYYSGKTIILDHGLGLMTMYAHLSRMFVRAGVTVKKGQIIGRVGSTGRVTGPHLHWALRVDGARVDPYSLLSVDFDAYLKPRSADPLQRSPNCGRQDLPKPAAWSPARGHLRARTRPVKSSYAVGEPVSFLVEIQNTGPKSAFVDFVREAGARAVVLGFNREPAPFETLASSATARLSTEQVKIPHGKTLCFEQPSDAGGPLLAGGSTTYALTYDTEFLYSSTTARAGLWRGRLEAPSAAVVLSTATSFRLTP